MIVTVDVGNSNVKFGISDNNEWVALWRVHTDIGKTADEYWILFDALIRGGGYRLEEVQRAVVSSVVPALSDTICSVVERLTGATPLRVSHLVQTGMDPESKTPPEMGNDLLANAVAAFHAHRRPTIVVDFGTAHSFTALSASGRVLGVAIAPGINTAVRTLERNTAQLPLVELEPPPQALARTTTHAIQAGVVYGYVGLVREVITRMGAEMESRPWVIATGGMADVLAPICDAVDEVRPWHTLEGLRILAELNPG